MRRVSPYGTIFPHSQGVRYSLVSIRTIGEPSSNYYGRNTEGIVQCGQTWTSCHTRPGTMSNPKICSRPFNWRIGLENWTNIQEPGASILGNRACIRDIIQTSKTINEVQSAKLDPELRGLAAFLTCGTVDLVDLVDLELWRNIDLVDLERNANSRKYRDLNRFTDCIPHTRRHTRSQKGEK